MEPIAIKKCDNCGKDVKIYHRKRLKNEHTFCNCDCMSAYAKNHQNLNCICPICGKKFHVKPHQLRDAKQEICCSRECMGKYRSKIYEGKNNPNYGNTGINSPLFVGITIKHCGYYWDYVPNHPFAVKGGRVRQHRLVAEKYLLTDSNSVYVNGKAYLSLAYDVHHIDGNKLNNDVNNLMVLTKSEHQKLHRRLDKEKKLLKE